MYKLRELARKDLKVINSWRNDKELISFLGAPFRYIDLEVDEAWFENYIKNRENGVRCAIVDEDDSLVGLISLLSIDYICRSAELHIMIGDKEKQGRGAGTYAVKEMLHHGFDNLNLQRISLAVLEENQRACHLYEKVGFVQEGILRKSKYKDGSYKNEVIYSVLREEF